jgi:hypothetical protein
VSKCLVHLWRVIALGVDVIRNLQHVTRTELDAPTTPFTPLDQYMDFSVWNSDVLQV